MLKSKRVLSLLLTVAMIFAMSCIGVFAADSVDESANIPILQVSENATQQEIDDAITEAIESSPEEEPVLRGYIEIKPFLIRSGNTSSCELYLKWTCPGYLCNAISFSNLKLTNGSSINRVVYSNIGGSTLPCETASQGTVRVLRVTIPTDVSMVIAESSGVMASIVGEGWISTISISGRVPFN